MFMQYLPPPLLPVYMATVGAGSVCTYCMCVMSSGKSITSHGMSVIIMHFRKTFPVVCNYSTHDCTLIVLSSDPEMMVVSVKSTALTHPLCPSVIRSVMSVGDLTFHTATVPSCRHKHTHHSNDNDKHRTV